MDTVSQIRSAPIDWGLYDTYKSKYQENINRYLSRTHIPDELHEGILHDTIVEMVIKGKSEYISILRDISYSESKHWTNRVSYNGMDNIETLLDDPIYHSRMPKIYTMLDGLPQSFLDKYCTEREKIDIENLKKYGSPLEYAKHCKYSNVLLAQRICMVMKKYKKHLQGKRIKDYDRWEIDITKASTPNLRNAALLYKLGLPYKQMSNITGKSTLNIATSIFRVKKK